MKKLFFQAAVIAAITLASCSRQDDGTGAYSYGESMPVGFRTFVGKSGGANTKGYVMYANGLEFFMVHAYNTTQEDWKDYTPPAGATPNFMTDQMVQYRWWDDNPTWEYTPTRYWPVRDGKVSFFAYASGVMPGSVPIGLDNVSFPTDEEALGPAFDFEESNYVASQTDLLGAIALNKTQSGGTVSLTFEHILSKIGFSAKTLEDYTPVKIEVTGLKIKTNAGANIERKAKFQFGTSDFETGNWTIISGNYFTLPADDDGVDFWESPTPVTLSDDVAKDINSAGMFIMLPPNQIIAKEAFTVKIFYTIDGTPYNVTIKLPAEDKGLKLDLGKQYTFNFTFSLHAVVFSGISTGGWDNSSAHQPGDTPL